LFGTGVDQRKRVGRSAVHQHQGDAILPEKLWADVEDYTGRLFVGEDEALAAALEASAKAGLPEIEVSPNQGKMLMLLACAVGARNILEIGTLGGYSAIWLARALPANGRLISLEAVRRHAEVARENIARAGLADRVEVRLGKALQSLKALEAEGEGPFDLTFIDADKANNTAYFRAALKMSRKGSIIVADNVVRYGGVLDGLSADPNVKGVRSFLDVVAAEPKVSATIMQTVGKKGHDGFALILVMDDI
jgi:predicted O-methyltransferase YrrM